jgi:hypothetical protein
MQTLHSSLLCPHDLAGSPTLGGHLPTQVSAMLGAILRLPDSRALPAGVYGSFGWSGEGVDILQDRLSDAGFNMAFKPIRVQFRPDAKALQVCEESGTDLAQQILRTKKRSQKQVAKRASMLADTQITGGLLFSGHQRDALAAHLAHGRRPASSGSLECVLQGCLEGHVDSRLLCRG